MRNITISRQLFGKEITADIRLLDKGISILLTGGQLSHIGAMSAISENGKMETIQFPEHKEAVLCEQWAKKIFGKVKCPVVVEAGIHYHDATKEDIAEILCTTDGMLVELLICLRDLGYIKKN